MAENNLIRLNKFLAEAGLASRRGADRLIESGKVIINGKRIYELGVRIDPKKDKITVDGKPIRQQVERAYFLFHKPTGVVTSMKDPEGRPTVADFFRKEKFRLFPVGRLDWNTEGLLIMTNDGDFANQVMHPKFDIAKVYLAKLDGLPTDEQLQKLQRGVTIPGGKVKAAQIKRLQKKTDKYGWIQMTVHEGKNQQVRRMFLKLGFSVTKLKRVQIGALKLGSLERGQYRRLEPMEVMRIFKKPNLKSDDLD